MGNNPDPSRDDNFHWRVIGSISLIVLNVLGVILVPIYSSALTALTIMWLFGYLFTLTLVTILLIFRDQSRGGNHIPKKWSMDNPLIAIIVAIIAGIIVEMCGKLFFIK